MYFHFNLALELIYEEENVLVIFWDRLFVYSLFDVFFSIPWKKKLIDVRKVLPHVSTLMFVQSKRNNSARPFFLMFVSLCRVPLTWNCVFVIVLNRFDKFSVCQVIFCSPSVILVLMEKPTTYGFLFIITDLICFKYK